MHTFSLSTNFSYAFERRGDQRRRKEQLLTQMQISGTLMGLQVLKSNEYYFFRVKPLPGTSIVDCLGQMRTCFNQDDVQMFFASNEHVMYSLSGQRMLTFDREAYLVEKDDSELYDEPLEFLCESGIEKISGQKYFLFNNKHGHITIVEEGPKSHGP